MRKSVDAAIAWFRTTAIHGRSYTRGPESRLIPTADAATVEEISRERRMGYTWYATAPQAALNAYDRRARR